MIERIIKSKEFLIFSLSFLIIGLFAGRLIGDLSISRFMAIRALVENHTWAIENVAGLDTVDKFFYNGHFYSSKPPLPAIVGASIYFIVKQITGLEFSEHMLFYNHIINWLTNGLAFAIILLFFYKSLKWHELEEKYKIFLTPMLGFCTLLFTYSGIFSNHVISACLVFLSFYQLLKIKFEGNKNKYFIAGGFFLSLAVLTEVNQSVIFLLFFLSYLIIKKETRKKVYLFILGGLPSAILYIIYNLHTTGTIFTPYFNFQSLYGYKDSYWLNPTIIDNFGHNRLFYSFNMLFGTQGVFLYSPILVYGFWGMIKAIREKNEKWYDLAKFAFVSCVSVLLFLLIATKNYGGKAYGLRWFTICIPIVFFFIPILIKYFENKKFLSWFMLSVFLSFVFALIGLGSWNTTIYEFYGIKMYFPLGGTAYNYYLDIISHLNI